MGKRKKKGADLSAVTMITILILMVGIGVYALVSAFVDDDSTNEANSGSTTTASLTNNQPSIGKEDAPVKLVEFGDYKCPSCRQFTLEIFPKLKKEYIDTGKVQFFFVNFAFLSQDSVAAAITSEAVYKQKPESFWKFHELVYQNQDSTESWTNSNYLVDLVKKHIPEIDANKLSADIKNDTYRNTVASENQLATIQQVEYVPTIFVNGKKTDVALDYEELKKVIEDELKKK
jgi:protein-disulfide isomerase